MNTNQEVLMENVIYGAQVDAMLEFEIFGKKQIDYRSIIIPIYEKAIKYIKDENLPHIESDVTLTRNLIIHGEYSNYRTSVVLKQVADILLDYGKKYVATTSREEFDSRVRLWDILINTYNYYFKYFKEHPVYENNNAKMVNKSMVNLPQLNSIVEEDVITKK